jgi:hypothetical protein
MTTNLRDKTFRSTWTAQLSLPPSNSFVPKLIDPPPSVVTSPPVVSAHSPSLDTFSNSPTKHAHPNLHLKLTSGAHRITATSPFMIALCECDLATIYRLLEEEPSCIFETEPECDHCAFLVACEMQDSLPIVKLMVDKGVNPNVECNRGINALAAALMSFKNSHQPEDLLKINYLLEVSSVNPVHKVSFGRLG